MALKESGEMYLETIYILLKSTSTVRSIDIAEHMNFSRASVSRGVGILRKNGYISIDLNGHITLTPNGLSVAKKIIERHEVLKQILIRIGIDEDTANDDACRIEHVISDVTFEHIKKYYNSND